MILIGIALFALGLLILPLAWRGRISARGQFCRKCRFDLAGSSMDAEGNKCPECGQPIYTQSARRTILRRSSKRGLIAALILTFLGSGSIAFGIWGNSASIYARLPDTIVVQGMQWGSSSALDEAVARSAISPRFVNNYSDDLVEYALKVQADQSQAWDPRLGQILIDSLQLGFMSPDQLRRYAINGWTHELTLRDRVHPGDDFIYYQLRTTGDRVYLTNFAATRYRYGARIIEYGVQGDDPVWVIDPRRAMGGRLLITSDPDRGTTLFSSLWKMNQYTTNAKIGESIPIYIDLEIRLESPDMDEPIVSEIVRLERSVVVVPDTEPIVELVTNPAHAVQIAKAITLGPLYTMEYPQAPGPNHSILMLKFLAFVDSIPDSFSFMFYLQIGDQEVPMGKLVRKGPDESPSGQSVQWGISPNDPEGLMKAMALHAIALESGQVDVILRTETVHALQHPTIDQVVDVTIEFNDVPIKIVETPQEVNNPLWDPVEITGRVKNE